MSFTPTRAGTATAPSRADAARDNHNNRNNNARLPQAGD